MITLTEDHKYVVDAIKYPSVTQILQKTGFIDTRWFDEWSRDRGSLVHLIIKWHINNELDESTVDPELQGYLDAWKKFERDTGFESQFVEKPMHSPEYGFCGTPDNIGMLNNKRSGLDYKSGIIAPWTGLQLAGYEILHGARMNRYGLQLKQDGKYSIKPFTDRNDKRVFLSALACYNWQNNHK